MSGTWNPFNYAKQQAYQLKRQLARQEYWKRLVEASEQDAGARTFLESQSIKDVNSTKTR